MSLKTWQPLGVLILSACILVCCIAGCRYGGSTFLSGEKPLATGAEDASETTAVSNSLAAPMTSDDGSIITYPSMETYPSGESKPAVYIPPSPTEPPMVPAEIADNHTPAQELITKAFRGNLFLLSDYMDRSSQPPMAIDDVLSGWGLKAECVRDMGNHRFYGVFLAEDGRRQLLFFDENRVLEYSLYLNRRLDKEAFLSLKKGDSCQKLLEIDHSLRDGYDAYRCEQKAAYLYVNTIRADCDYTLHLFEDSLLVIAWDRLYLNDQDLEISLQSRRIRDLRWYDSRQFTLDSYDGGKTWDFRILPIDYPQ